MNKEIERKFLPANDDWKSQLTNTYSISQYYINTLGDIENRVRIIVKDGERTSFLTYKSNSTTLVRNEVEIEVSNEEAYRIINTFKLKSVDKVRGSIHYHGNEFTVDVFMDGRVLIELELDSEDSVPHLPDWIGEEVTGNPEYYGSGMEIHKVSDLYEQYTQFNGKIEK